MQDFLMMYFDWIRAGHIISMIAWMAGMLYLPRLFVYHVDAPIGSEMSDVFKNMERRLLKIIINPAMILTWVFGGLMLYTHWELFKITPWMHAKLFLVVIMTGVAHAYIKYVKDFANDNNQKSSKYFRILNEVPTVLMIIIVILAVVEPF